MNGIVCCLPSISNIFIKHVECLLIRLLETFNFEQYNFVNMLLCVCLLVFSASLLVSSSVPGAPWTGEETLIVKAKLLTIMTGNGKSNGPGVVKENLAGYKEIGREYLALHPELDWASWYHGKSYPKAPKFLRLGFHGCLK